ncbi:MAG: DEAD/DEAH box helicase [Pseudomonadota bacterium]
MSTFDLFHLPPPVLSALRGMQYSTPTPIQSEAIPAILEGTDLVGIAQTGTGKTAAFGIPIVTILSKDPAATALILVPTRELAAQIHDVLTQLTRNLPAIRSCVVIGGASMHLQRLALTKRPRIVIATPGRLLDHLEQRTISFTNLKILVLDEADRMLDIGFEPQLKRIFRHVPPKRQTLLFSATFPASIERLAAQHLNHPKKISVGAISRPVDEVQQSFVNTTALEKNNVLLKELAERKGSVLIFARTKRRTDRVARLLSDSGFKADRIHGNRTQGQRTAVMDGFRKERFRILVATDIASRGLDIPHIAHVINYDLPQVPEDYIHRIGRTARAGAQGSSLCLLTPDDRDQWIALSRHLDPKSAPPLPKGRVRTFRPPRARARGF